MNCGGTSKAGLLWVISDDDGATWACQDRLRGHVTDEWASVTADSSDNLYVVYACDSSGAAGDDICYRKFTKGAGSNWTMGGEQHALNLTISSTVYSYPVVELEGTTRLWLATRFFYDANSVYSVEYNSDNSYWLIGGYNGRLNKYDGSTFTDVSSNLDSWTAGSELYPGISTIVWNGSNFLIGGDEYFAANLCNSSLSCSDVSSTIGWSSTVGVNAIGWNGSVWLVGGESGNLKECNAAVTSCTTKTLSNWGTADVNAISWNPDGSYWLIGGGSAKLNKYDGSTFTDLSGSLVNFGTSNITTIDYNTTDNYFLIGGIDKKLNNYDGTDFTDVSGNLDANWASTDDITWVEFGGSNWLIAGYNQVSKCSGALSCSSVTTASLVYLGADWNGSFWLIGAVANRKPNRLLYAGTAYATEATRLKKYDLSTVTDLGDSLVNFGDDKYQVKVYYSDGLGASPTWTESAELDTAGTTAFHVPTIVRFGSNIGVIYLDNSGNIKWRTRADSDGLTSWNSEANVGTGEQVRSSSVTGGPVFSATVDDSDQVHVAYLYSTSGYPVRYTFYNGSSWSTPISLATSNISDSSGAQITTDGTSVWVIWNDGSNGLSFGSSVKGKLSYKKGVSPFTSSDFDTDPTAINSADRIYDQVWTYISSSYADETTDAGNQTSADVAMPSVTDDIIYFGMTEKFRAVSWWLSTYGSSGIVAWEYYNGASWTSLTLVKYSNRYFTVSTRGTVYFDSPSDWAQIQVNTDASPGFYYVRARVTADYSTTPVGTQMAAISGSIAVSGIILPL